MKIRILHNIRESKRARQPSVGPLNGGFWWSESRNAPGRITFADKIKGVRISHAGWFCDSHQDEEARGIVCALTHGRYLAGFEDGRGNWEVTTQVFSSAEDAAYDADEQARIYAEKEYEYNEAWREGDTLRAVIEEKRNDVFELFSARHHPRVRSDIKGHLADIRVFQAEFKALCNRYDLSY